MTRILAVIVAMGLSGCGTKKPADAPAAQEPKGEPSVPAGPPPSPATPPTETSKQLKLLKSPSADIRLKAATALAALADTDATVIPGLVELLSDSSGPPLNAVIAGRLNSPRETATFALMLCGTAGENAAVEKALPVLMAALSDSSAVLRYHAAAALGRMGARAAPAVEKLWLLAADGEIKVREMALRAITELGGVSPAPLCKLLTHPDRGVRATAAENLRYFDPAPIDAVNDLASALADEGTNVRLAAAEALNRVGAKAAPAMPALLSALAKYTRPNMLELDEFLMRVVGSLVVVGEPAVPELMKQLENPSPVLRYLAVYSLGEIGPSAKSASAAIEKLLADRVGEIQLEATRAIVTVTGSIDKAKQLIEFGLKHPEARTRQAVLRLGIARMGPAGNAFAPAALELLADTSAEVRAAALDYVATLDAKTAKPAVEKIAALLKDDEPNTRLRAASVLGLLGRTAAPAAASLATAASTDAVDRVRLAALEALAELGPDAKAAVGPLTKLAADGPANLRAKALTVSVSLAPTDSGVTAAVIKALADKSEDVRTAALLALATVENPSPDTLRKLGDLIATASTFAERTQAVRVAARLGTKAASLQDKLQAASQSDVRDHALWAKLALTQVRNQPDEAQALARSLLASRIPFEKNVALQALGELLTPTATESPVLLAATQDRSAPTRQAAAVSLGKLPSASETVARLTELLQDPDQDVKRAAIASLERLGPKAHAATHALRELANSRSELARPARKALRAVEVAD